MTFSWPWKYFLTINLFRIAVGKNLNRCKRGLAYSSIPGEHRYRRSLATKQRKINYPHLYKYCSKSVHPCNCGTITIINRTTVFIKNIAS